MTYHSPDPDELLPSEAELEAQRRAARAPGESQAWGSGIGGILGALAGGALGTFVAPGLGTAAGATLGGSLGGGLGGVIGGGLGNGQADKAEKLLTAADLERQKKIAQFQMH